jgi:hypothetical protein
MRRVDEYPPVQKGQPILSPYAGLSNVGIVFTMPDVLWPIFQKNRHLLHDLPTLGAAVIQQWAKLKYGVRVGANANAQSNVLINIVGDTALSTGLTPVITVHISNNHTVTDGAE